MSTITEPTDADIARMSAFLKPCPFCGSDCVIEWTPVPDFSGRSNKPRSISWHVQCNSVGSRCPMGKHWLCSTWDAAIGAWNKRAP